MNKAKMILEAAQMILQIVEDVKRVADNVQNVCNFVLEGLSEETPKAIEAKATKKAEPEVSMEKVRSVLAQKSQAGFTTEVRTIIQKYGASRLSEIDPKDFKAVLADAEELGNE